MQLNKPDPFQTRNDKRRVLADTAILTINDYERILKNGKMYSKDEMINNQRLLTEQKDAQMAKSQALKDKLISIDRTRLKEYGQNQGDLDRINEEEAKALEAESNKGISMSEDAIKDMNKLVLYAKTATIRDRQLDEHKQMEGMYRGKESKLDTMMELERLKELRFQEDREISRKKQQKEGALIIIEQIKEKEHERLKHKEVLEKERILILRQIKELEEEEKRLIEQKRIRGEQLAKEVVQTNKISGINKEKKKLMERELELNIMKYNIDKDRREEEELAERKRIRDEKERETQKLREKQERAQDKQAELDALRAKRAYEESERQARLKKRTDELIKQRKIEELLEANKKQKYDKELKIAELAKQEQEEHEKIIKRQLESQERDRRIMEEMKRMRYENKNEVMKQILMNEDKNRLGSRNVLEEGRKIKQKQDLYHKRMEKIRQEKIRELKGLNVKQDYINDLERYKIV